MARRLAVLLLLAVAAPACREAGASGTAGHPPSTTTTTAIAVVDDGPIEQAVSIHVEGQLPYDAHRRMVDDLADEAMDAGVTLTFELSRRFTEGSLAAGDGFVASLAARGHGVGVHADLGFPAIGPAAFTRRLAEHKALVEQALGAPVTVVSGICSAGPWVESAVAAGFTVATGTVDYCLMSTDDAPACASPVACHDPLPGDPTTAPWRTSSSSDWLTPDPNGALWIVPSQRVLPVGARPPAGFVADLAATPDVTWTSVADLAR